MSNKLIEKITDDEFSKLLGMVQKKYPGLTQEKICRELGYNDGFISQMFSRDKISVKFANAMIAKFLEGDYVIVPDPPEQVISDSLSERRRVRQIMKEHSSKDDYIKFLEKETNHADYEIKDLRTKLDHLYEKEQNFFERIKDLEERDMLYRQETRLMLEKILLWQQEALRENESGTSITEIAERIEQNVINTARQGRVENSAQKKSNKLSKEK